MFDEGSQNTRAGDYLQKFSIKDQFRANKIHTRYRAGRGRRSDTKVTINGKTTTVKLDAISGNTAVVTLSAEDFSKLANANAFGIAAEVDTHSARLPEGGQRIPTAKRQSDIQKAYEDPYLVHDGHTEVIRCFAFGIEVDQRQRLVIRDGGILGITDGAGRTSSEIRESARQAGPTNAIKKNLTYVLVVNLSGDISNSLREFRLLNRLVTKANQGTNTVVECGLLSLDPDRVPGITDLDAATFIVRQLYAEYSERRGGSLLGRIPWNMQGETVDDCVFEKSFGRGSGIATALSRSYAGRYVISSGISITEFPTALNLAFRVFYDMCPNARENKMMLQKISPDRANEEVIPRMYSTIGLALIIFLTAKIYPITGADEVEFGNMISKIIQTHWTTTKPGYFKNSAKKMTPDKFWYSNSLMADPVNFNSGAKNTTAILNSFNGIADLVLEGRDKRQSHSKASHVE